MTIIPDHFQLPLAPVAHSEAVVRAPGARFTILTSRLIRIEHDPQEAFVDQASQIFWFREQPVPSFDVRDTDGHLEIFTEHLRLSYLPGPSAHGRETISISLRETGETWRYGDVDHENLKGTLRTLDLASGAAKLEPGLLSRSGWVVVDDSQSLLFNEQGWLEPRRTEEALDLYFFGYGQHYLELLQDYFKVAGSVPLLPRWALGNWWSRYWEYSQEELADLVRDFRQHDIPLSVCIIDMDWHITDTGNESSGWTGYTWNRELFPDPQSFLQWLDQEGLKTGLNLHPAEGVHPHEEAYEAFSRAMGMDPQTQEPVPFDIANPQFIGPYFELLHHPLEEQGVDFWWMDWQQGTLSGMPGLDPLWWLNHLHFYDLARDGKTRPFIFSRWGGLGNHRYPIGFSGDTYVNWSSLSFQPYQTATASNVGFGWWSHDIGGHLFGIEEAELYARWVQFGVFSPIMRLHSTKNPYHERRPWGYDAETLRIVRQAMQLRHAIIPYLYTMSWLNQSLGISPIRPLYHDYPQCEEAYSCPDQYTFGSELIAAPYITPADPDTRLSRQVVWLPPGDWFHFFDGRYLQGDGWHAVHGKLDEIPVFARAGAIVPLGPMSGWGNVANPDHLDVVVFPGADHQFDLYEDDGETQSYLSGAFALTRFKQQWAEDRLTFIMEPAQGDASHVPQRRTVRLLVRGVNRPHSVSVQLNGEAQEAAFTYTEQTGTLSLPPVTVTPEDSMRVDVAGSDDALMKRVEERQITLKRMIETFRLETSVKAMIVERLDEIFADPALLRDYAVALSESHLRAMLEVIRSAGVHQIDHTGEQLVIMWNNDENENVTYRLSELHHHRWLAHERFRGEEAVVPRFRTIAAEKLSAEASWQLLVHYDTVLTLQIENGGLN